MIDLDELKARCREVRDVSFFSPTQIEVLYRGQLFYISSSVFDDLACMGIPETEIVAVLEQEYKGKYGQLQH